MCVRACVCVRALGMHTQADPSSSPTLIEVDVPLLFGGSTEGPLLTGQRRVLIELFWWARGEVHYNADTLIMCLHPLGPTPPPPPPNNVIDLLFNAQTNSSLIIPGYFLGSVQSSKEKKAMWNELEKELYLLNKSGKWFISVKWNGRWVVWRCALKKNFLFSAPWDVRRGTSALPALFLG